MQWLQNQVEALLGQQDDRKLTVISRRLQQEDYQRLMILIEARGSVRASTLKDKLLGERDLVIKGKTFASLDYVQKLIADTAQVAELYDETLQEVCALA